MNLVLIECRDDADLLLSADGYCWHQYDTEDGDEGRYSIDYPTYDAAVAAWPNPEWAGPPFRR